MSAVTLARIAIPLIIGGAIGYALRDHEAEEVQEAREHKAAKQVNLRQKLYDHGRDLIDNRERYSKEGGSLSDYLKQTYLGLYCIGRTGAVLQDTVIDALALELAHVHKLHRKRKDAAISEWYQSVGVNNPHKIADLLADCREVAALGVDTRYIARALGEHHMIDVGNIAEATLDLVRVK